MSSPRSGCRRRRSSLRRFVAGEFEVVDFILVELLEREQVVAVDVVVDDVGGVAAGVGETTEVLAAQAGLEPGDGRLGRSDDVTVARLGLAPPLGDVLVGGVDLRLALGAVDRSLELADSTTWCRSRPDWPLTCAGMSRQ